MTHWGKLLLSAHSTKSVWVSDNIVERYKSCVSTFIKKFLKTSYGVNNTITNTVKFHHQTDENIIASLFTSFVNKQRPNISLIRVNSYPYLWCFGCIMNFRYTFVNGMGVRAYLSAFVNVHDTKIWREYRQKFAIRSSLSLT